MRVCYRRWWADFAKRNLRLSDGWFWTVQSIPFGLSQWTQYWTITKCWLCWMVTVFRFLLKLDWSSRFKIWQSHHQLQLVEQVWCFWIWMIWAGDRISRAGWQPKLKKSQYKMPLRNWWRNGLRGFLRKRRLWKMNSSSTCLHYRWAS